MKPTGLLAKSFDSRCSMLREVLAKKNSSVLLSLTKSFVGKTPVSRGVLVNKKTMTQEGSTKSADSQDSGSSETRTRKKTSAAWSSEVKSSTKSVGIQGSGLSGIQTKTKTSAVGTKKNSGVKSPPSITMQDLASSSEKPKVSLKQVLSKSKELNSSAKQARTSKIAAKKVQASPRASFSPRRSVSGVARGLASPLASLSRKPSLIRVASLNAKKHRGLKLTPRTKETNAKQLKIKNSDPVQCSDKLKESKGNMVQGKTLHVIKMEADNKHVESDLRCFGPKYPCGESDSRVVFVLICVSRVFEAMRRGYFFF
ncbi:hypothetical protein Peur_052645 [Populus x canadensis]